MVILSLLTAFITLCFLSTCIVFYHSSYLSLLVPVVFALVIGSGGYTAAKTVGKVAIKVIGVSTGATTGAMIGSVIPFAGTAVGGIIGGIVGWFTVDAAAIKVSEHFGRKDFEAELTALIDEQQAIVKSEFRKKVKDSMEEVMKASPEVIIGLGK